METAFSRHATSKLRTADDLRNIATLGFRGEALPSIAAVSVLTCVTCTADADAATRYHIRYGEPEDQPRPTGAAVGTNITVENLFGNQPARLKFLRTKPTEAAHVQRVVARYAMAYPTSGSRTPTTATRPSAANGTGKLQETILSIMGHDVASKMLPVLLDDRRRERLRLRRQHRPAPVEPERHLRHGQRPLGSGQQPRTPSSRATATRCPWADDPSPCSTSRCQPKWST